MYVNEKCSIQIEGANSPQIVLLDAANSIHRVDVRSDTQQFNSDLSAFLDDLVFIVRPLPWGSVRIKLYIFGYELDEPRQFPHSRSDSALEFTSLETKSDKGPAFAKNPSMLTLETTASTCADFSATFAGGGHRPYSLSLERPPHYGTIPHCKLSISSTWKNAPF